MSRRSRSRSAGEIPAGYQYITPCFVSCLTGWTSLTTVLSRYGISSSGSTVGDTRGRCNKSRSVEELSSEHSPGDTVYHEHVKHRKAIPTLIRPSAVLKHAPTSPTPDPGSHVL
ncbi:hypothetical protein BJX70DRAFT_383836 [Aspergillus crustosus]